MTRAELKPEAIPHSRLTLPSVSLLQGKIYMPASAGPVPAYLNGRNGLLVSHYQPRIPARGN